MAVWMTLLVLGVGFFVPFVMIKTVLAQFMLRFERDDAFWVALAGHCANTVAGAPLFALMWWLNSLFSHADSSATPSVVAIALYYAALVIPFDIWTAQGIIRNGSYPELDDNHPSCTLTQKAGLTTMKLVMRWAIVGNIVCIVAGLGAMLWLSNAK